ncbi:MAG: Crp/Fnr family transcriptional regulator [Bacteroidales bacterium]|nr:Crp/Fnr family transcriptional regulator [Bacteroidales bacterium]
MNTNCAVCSNRSSCFNTLSINELQKVSENKNEILFRKGETIIKQDASAKHIYFIKSGLAKVHVQDESKNLILEIAGKSSMLGITVLNHNKRYNFSATAMENVEVCEIDIDVISNIITNNVAFSSTIINELNVSIDKLLTKVFCLSQKNIQSRMAELLVSFSDQTFKSRSFTIPMSRTDLAEITSMAKENVVRILKEFEGQGYIKVNGKHFEILDYDRLSKLC